jgi:hypothetical protein
MQSMDKFIALPMEDKAAAFQEAANRRGILPNYNRKGFLGVVDSEVTF